MVSVIEDDGGPPGSVACYVCRSWFDPFEPKQKQTPVPDDDIEIED
jgi:hypothetical protein